jgi:hypothetical protein
VGDVAHLTVVITGQTVVLGHARCVTFLGVHFLAETSVVVLVFALELRVD